MKKLNITVFTKDINYANDLVRGLCNECTGLVVFVAKDRVEANESLERGILLTDYTDFPQENQIDKLKSVRKILQQAIELNFVKTGELFEIDEGSAVLIGFYSTCGGAGTTSIAVTYSRFLSVKSEKKVLFVNLGIADDYDKFICNDRLFSCDNFAENEASRKKPFSKHQFVFMCEHRREINYDEYFLKDKYGVHYFKPEKGQNSFRTGFKDKNIIELLKEQKHFEYIVVDLGKLPGGFEDEEQSQVFDEVYKIDRANGGVMEELNDYEREGQKVHIKDKQNDVGIEAVDIPTDCESFICGIEDEFEWSNRAIDISMTGKFATAVEKLFKNKC